MATKIRSVQIGSIPIQSGFGIPIHVSLKGSLYIDLETALLYINKDGVSLWAEELDSNYQFLLTQNQYDAINNANNPNSGNTFATIADLSASSGDTKEVKASASDTTAGFLEQKLTGSTNISVTVINSGGNEQILFQQTGLATLSGATFLGSVTSPSFSASSITSDYFYGNGSNLTGISTQDTKVTGGTYSNVTGIATFTNSTGGTFNVTGFFKSSDDIYTTGLTFNNGTYILTTGRNDGTNLTANLSILASDVTITGGTYNINTGTVTFTNNTGGTFTVSGFSSGITDTYITSFSYDNANKISITDSSGGTFTTSINTMTGLTVNGTIQSTTFSAATYQGLPLDIRVTGGTFNNNDGIATFNNNTGGTFTVTGLTKNENNITKDFTGFVSTDDNLKDIVITYNLTGKTITLAGTFKMYYQGNVILDVSGSTWTSDVHPNNPITNYYLYYNQTGFVWANTMWKFSDAQIASLSYTPTGFKFASRECHGLMDWECHEHFHDNVGTVVSTGADITGILVNSTTLANRRPLIGVTELSDEDLYTTLPALTTNSYTIMNLSGSGINVFTTGNADIVPLLTNNPYYNAWNGANWIQTLVANNAYMCMWGIAIPVTSDATSQAFRYLWVQGQSSTSLLATQQGLVSNSLNLGSIKTLANEFVFFAKIILRFTGGNWVITQVDSLRGNKLQQTSFPSGNYLSAVNTDTTLIGDGTVGNVLGVNPNLLISALTATTISATTYQNLPLDIRVTGGTYTTGTAIFTNNTGGTFSITGLTTPFTGGTVAGATIFTGGLSANTFSSTTITTYNDITIGNITVGRGGGALSANTAIGYQALNGNSTGTGNVGNGYRALYAIGAGSNNVALGYQAMRFSAGSNANGNVSVGYQSLYANVSGATNVGLGYYALYSMTNTSSIGIGNSAGRYATASNELYIDNRDRTNNINEKSQAIIYGLMGTTPATQTLALNAVVSINSNYSLPTVSGVSGSFLTSSGSTTTWTKPTTLSGYGITNAYTTAQADSKFVYKTGDTMTGELKTPSLIVYNGQSFVGGDNITIEDTFLKLGYNRIGNGKSYIDLHSAGGSNYNAQIIRNSGVNGDFEIKNTGTGSTKLYGADSATAIQITRADGTTPTVIMDTAGAGSVGYTTVRGDSIEVGMGKSVDSLSYIDWHSTIGSDYDSRIVRWAGSASNLDITNNGTGSIRFINEVSPNVSPVEAMSISNASIVSIANDAYISGVRVGNGAYNRDENTCLGTYSLGATISTSVSNTAVGRYTLANTIGSYNTTIGDASLTLNSGGTGNNAFGAYALYNNASGNENVAIGQNCLANNLASGNIAIGHYAMVGNINGAYNTVIGRLALQQNEGGGNVVIGNAAAYRQTTSAGKFFLHNTDLASAADELTQSLIYGKFDCYNGGGSVANQELHLNAKVSIGGDLYSLPTVTGEINKVIGRAANGTTQWVRTQRCYKTTIDLKTATDQLIFTTESDAAFGRFVITNLFSHGDDVTGTGTRPSTSIGITSPTYNDILVTGDNITKTISGTYDTNIISGVVVHSIANGTGVYVKVNTAPTYTTFIITLIVEGYYLG